MENLVEIWEQYLEDAIEIKNKKPLHHLLVSLADNIVQRSVYEKHLIEIKSEIRILTENMQRGFELVEKRFEAVDDLKLLINVLKLLINVLKIFIIIWTSALKI